jgi:hypothetical protein
VAVSADGSHVVSAAADGSVMSWRLEGLSSDPDQLLERLRDATRVCLSAEQRARELGEDPKAASLAAQECERGGTD